MKERETPETDATRRDVIAGKWSLTEPGGLLEKLETLECQRDEAREESAMWEKHTVAALRQRDELLAALEEVRRLASDSKEGFEEDLPGIMNSIVREARAAIAAVKGEK